VAAHVKVCDRLFNFRHVTADAFIARTAGPVMGVFFDRRCARTVRGLRAVAFEAHHVRGLKQVRIIARPMNVMAVETTYAVGVHDALDEVVSLRAVFMGACPSIPHRQSTQRG
jgi:hypothetical protein